MSESKESLFSVKSNGTPQGKPRVYFCCHPDDFDRYFEKVCNDILNTQNCAIFYTEDMSADISSAYTETDLGRMNLFVVPVTFHLLTEDNRAMRSDLEYAKEHNIAILPLMMESGIDEIYSLDKNFGNRQYLAPFVTDLTAVSYEEKLKKYLEAVLVSEETAKKIRAAFDAYIFLSYRKKDRQLANELMKKIHSDPKYRDIAIWYDEFIVPGEDFRTNIQNALNNSKLFTLLVTPNLVNEDNFVKDEEYPTARNTDIPIFATEMEKTDRDALNTDFPGLPECVDFYNDDEFNALFADSLSKIALSENADDPEHNYLIGLAYLGGIDVEKNTEKAIELFFSAAKNNQIEAQKKLYDLAREYYDNNRYNQSKRICERLVKVFQNGKINQNSLVRIVEIECLLSSIFILRRDPFNAKNSIINALSAYEQINTQTSHDSVFSIIEIQCKLAFYFLENCNYLKSRKYYLKALKSLSENICDTNNNYSLSLIEIYKNLAIDCLQSRELDSSEANEYISLAIEYIEKASLESAVLYKPIIAECYHIKARISFDLKHGEEYVYFLFKSKLICEENNHIYKIKIILAKIYIELAKLCLASKNNYAEDFFLSGIKVYEELYHANPNVYCFELARAYDYICIYYERQGKIEEKEIFAQKSYSLINPSTTLADDIYSDVLDDYIYSLYNTHSEEYCEMFFDLQGDPISELLSLDDFCKLFNIRNNDEFKTRFKVILPGDTNNDSE